MRIRTLALASQGAHIWIIADRTLGRRRLRDTQVRSRLCRGVPSMTNLILAEDTIRVVLADPEPQASLQHTRSMSKAYAGLAEAIGGMSAEPGESDALASARLAPTGEAHASAAPLSCAG